jgi:hypothetical protein
MLRDHYARRLALATYLMVLGPCNPTSPGGAEGETEKEGAEH